MTTQQRQALLFFRKRFRKIGNAKRAAGEKAYLKSPLRFHGVAVPDIRRACADFCREHQALRRNDLRGIVSALYATDFHDLRSVGIALLERKHALLIPEDTSWLIDLVRLLANWAHVDWLATKVMGRVVAADRCLLPQIRIWAKDSDFWVRRTALLAQHDALRSGEGDFELFAEIAAPMLPEKQFFIRKAIGWVLREVSKKRPKLTYGFLRQNGKQLSGLTLREGAKHLPEDLRASLNLPSRRAN